MITVTGFIKNEVLFFSIGVSKIFLVLDGFKDEMTCETSVTVMFLILKAGSKEEIVHGYRLLD